MFWPLALILLAVALFTALVIHRRPVRGGPRLGTDQLVGFGYVGSAALVLLAVAVVLLGMHDDRNGLAEAVAVLGFLAYGLYLLAAALITYLSARPS